METQVIEIRSLGFDSDNNYIHFHCFNIGAKRIKDLDFQES